MFRSIGIAATLAVTGATPVLAQSWEAVSSNDAAVAAVDWGSLDINGSRREVTFAMVSLQSGAVPFDYAVSTIDMDCSQLRYATIRSQFFDRRGRTVVEDFVGDGSWTPLAEGTIMGDVRREVCSSNPSRKGYFSTAQDFAVGAWRVAEQGQ
ncbi:surface-adhesin E family protein [Brevundimonas sp.]|uniref:surface-adhesin E family protein n=1 Tax=Brevundimonas sp. TaxID=1871086 RepID=UPI001DE7459E|nr:surface-adhesin E family protein [Brevundimonas sp.]MBL0947600.1 hypothetical protein [Brevundimonas sp.]